MFGSKRNRGPPTRLQVGCSGALFLVMGAFFLWAMAFGERDPSAPTWALYVAFGIALCIALAGAWLLVKVVLWDGDERR
jgi:hypothetical protein